MNKTPRLIITKLGLQMLIEAKKNKQKISLKDFRIGAGENNIGSFDSSIQTKLWDPKYKTINIKILEDGTNENQLYLSAYFTGIELHNLDYEFREIGVFLNSGELFALFSSKDTLLLEQPIDGVLIVNFYIEVPNIKEFVIINHDNKIVEEEKPTLLLTSPVTEIISSQLQNSKVGSILMPTPIITAIGLSAMFRAKQKGFRLSITKMAVGSGDNNMGYLPLPTQKELKNILTDTKVTGGQLVGIMQNQLHLTALLAEDSSPSSNKNYDIFEIGFYLETGELFAICSSPNGKLATKGAYTDLYLGFDILLTGQNSTTVQIDGKSTLSRPSIKDNMIYGDNVIKIHTQDEFNEIFNKGKLTKIPENQTIILSPIQCAENKAFIKNIIKNIKITDMFDSEISPGLNTGCKAENHGLVDGSSVDIKGGESIEGSYGIFNVTKDTFDIDKPFVAIDELTATATGYKAIGYGILEKEPVTGRTNILLPDHGLTYNSLNPDLLISLDDINYTETFNIMNIEKDSFLINAEFIQVNNEDGACGGIGDLEHNTFNGRPAYILKNSITLGSNTSIIGFNTNDTIVVKADEEVNIQIIGSADKPVSGVNLEGWTFDGRGGVDDQGGIIKAASNGSAFLLDNVKDSELNCQIINHHACDNGGWIYGTENSKNITAKHILHNKTSQGCGIYNCDTSIFRVQKCLVGSIDHKGSVAYNSSLSVQGELQTGSLMIGEWSISEVDGELSFKKLGQEALLIELPFDNVIIENTLINSTINLEGDGENRGSTGIYKPRINGLNVASSSNLLNPIEENDLTSSELDPSPKTENSKLITLLNGLEVKGAAIIASNGLDVLGKTTLMGDLDILGKSKFLKKVSFEDILEVKGDLRIDQKLTAKGGVETKNIMIGDWSIIEINGNLSFQKSGHEGLLVKIDNLFNNNQSEISATTNLENDLEIETLNDQNEIDLQSSIVINTDKNGIDFQYLKNIYPDLFESMKLSNEMNCNTITHEQIIAILLEAIKGSNKKEAINTIELEHVKNNLSSCMTILFDLRNKVKELELKNEDKE